MSEQKDRDKFEVDYKINTRIRKMLEDLDETREVRGDTEYIKRLAREIVEYERHELDLSPNRDIGNFSSAEIEIQLHLRALEKRVEEIDDPFLKKTFKDTYKKEVLRGTAEEI